MGAKTALLAFADGDLVPALRGATACDPAEAEDLVRRVHPESEVTRAEGDTLFERPYPPDGITYATVLAGAELLCDRRLVLDRPSKLPEHPRAAGAGRRIIMHGMHSMVDWVCFAVWEDGKLIRSLSLSTDGGIEENIGEPYDFELPLWAGQNPDPYRLPFHPLELGERALRALFGFVVEGRRDPGDIDAEAVSLHGFRVTDRTGRERAERVF
ncbi:DUF6928 family protein [Rhizomonospora bruguierae]|uniref:DUF6928 family protein n=1 Tax=Rhizomonospora bruguierae TaxID=1581705 RepID=UPI001BD00FFA|nr:hypothetical protein [Micromonospora sp. NBRC 107566]